MRRLEERGLCDTLSTQGAIHYLLEGYAGVCFRAATNVGVTTERCALRGKCFPTFATAGSASDGSIRSYYHVSKFAGGPDHTVIDLSIKNYACAESLFDKNHDEIADLADLGATKPQLGKRQCVRIIINFYRQARSNAHFFSNGPIAPLETRDEKRVAGL